MKTMKRILSMLLCLAMVIGFIPTFTLPARAADGAWTLVTDASTLAVDDQIVIAAFNANYALSTNQKSSNRDAASITKNGNTATIGDDIQILTLKEGKSAGTFGFYTGSAGYLYAASSSGNQLKSKTTLDAHGSWTITIASDGKASIVAAQSSNRNVMQYNPNNGSPLFACYKSASQQALCIYKYVEASSGGDEGGEGEDTTCKHANLGDATHVDGVHAAVCADCGETIVSEDYTVTVAYTDAGHTVTCTCNYSSGEVAHSMPETWTVVTPATYEAAGLEQRKCAGCDYTEDREIPQLEISGKTYVKYTAENLVTGTYIIISANNNNIAMGINDGGWITAVQPLVISDTEVTDDNGGVWTLTVDGNYVTLTDANGVSPKSNNANKLTTGDYQWIWVRNEDGTFTFKSQDTAVRVLAANTNEGSKCRCYAETEAAKSNYRSTFILYKLENEAAACDHEFTYTTDATKHKKICSKCQEPQADPEFHNALGDNSTCSICGANVDTTVLFPAILKEAYELAPDATMSGNVTLTGVIINYKKYASSATVDIVVGGDTARPIQCYKLVGTGYDTLAVGDTITVTGNIKNYTKTLKDETGEVTGTQQIIEFDGCTLVSFEKHTCEYTYSSEGATVGCIGTCSICGATTGDVEHVDSDEDGYCDNCTSKVACDHVWKVTHDGAHVETCTVEGCGVTNTTDDVITTEEDETGHWFVCSCGEYTSEVMEHTYVDDVCSVCKFVKPLDVSGFFQKVDMSAGITEGYYVIGGTSGSSFPLEDGSLSGFMSNTQDGTKNRFKATTLEQSCITVTTKDANVIWKFIAVDGGFQIMNAGTHEYLYHQGSENEIYWSDDVAKADTWVIAETAEGSGVYTIKKVYDDNTFRALSINRLGNKGSYYYAFAAYKQVSNQVSCNINLYAEVDAANEHVAGEAVIENEKEATCVAGGSYDSVVNCTLCDTEMSRETITTEPTGEHAYGEGVVKDATCTEAGSITYTCNVCGGTKAEEIEATGHTAEAQTNCAVAVNCSVCGEVVHAAKDHTADAQTNCEVAVNCSVCGEVVYAAKDHAYEGGTCINCGAEEPASGCGDKHTFTDMTDLECDVCGAARTVTVNPALNIISTTINMKSSLRFGFRIEKDAIKNAENFYVVFFKAEGRNEQNVTKIIRRDDPDMTLSGNYYAEYPVIPAAEMGAQIQAVLYVVDAEGNLSCSEPFSRSVEEYLKLALSTYIPANNTKAVRVAVELLYYGAAAQDFFNYKEDAMVNSGSVTLKNTTTVMTVAEIYEQYKVSGTITPVNVRDYGNTTENNASGLTWKSSTLDLKEKIYNQIKVDIKNLGSNVDMTKLTVVVKDQETGELLETVNGTAFTPDGKLFYVPVAEIKPANMSRVYTLEAFYDGESVSTVMTYSVESFVALAIKANHVSKDVAMAALRYGMAVALMG